MQSTVKRVVLWGLLTVIAFVIVGIVFYLSARPPADVRAYVDFEIRSGRGRGIVSNSSTNILANENKSLIDVQRLSRLNTASERCLQLARQFPRTAGGTAALVWATCNAAGTDHGREASSILVDWVNDEPLENLALGIRMAAIGHKELLDNLAPPLLQRIRANLFHPDAAYLLAQVCVMSRIDPENELPNETFVIAADLIKEHYANSKDITNFCECLSDGVGSPLWSVPFEAHLRVILDQNTDRLVCCTASMALPHVVELNDERQEEAEALYRRFIATYDGRVKYRGQAIERNYVTLTTASLIELRDRGIHRIAPEIVGVDVDGKTMTLSEHKGKVVMLTFWATWCAPCMKMISVERQLNEQFKEKPFTIIGVNGDSDKEALRKAIVDEGITWRSFQDSIPNERPISEKWGVISWPTIYLIDQRGLIHKRWRRALSAQVLSTEIDGLVEAGKTTK